MTYPKLQRLGRVYDLASEVKVVRDGDDSFEQNRGTDWTDVGLGRYDVVSSNEHEKKEEIPISEREDTPTNRPAGPIHPPQAPHAPPAADQDDAAASLLRRKYERSSALARKNSKAAAKGEV